MRVVFAVLAACLLSPVEGVEFKEGDRVVLLGNTFIEREGNYGCIETQLAVSLAGKNLTFRNLGWSGDNVFCEARSYFGSAQEGFNRLKAHLEFLKPTVVIACYGAVAAFEGKRGVENFLNGYSRLLDMIKATSGARVVLLSPPPCETLSPPLPDMTEQNRRLAHYRDKIRELAKSNGCAFADLFGALQDGKAQAGPAGTFNGVHFSERGYRGLAPIVAATMGVEESLPEVERLEGLRKLVIEKNRLFFNRWRPQNETYLHGFRKHEQGRNAKEILQFDLLVAGKDRQIQQLARKVLQR
jgi:lysophospholipase L1-like esterase